jgi:hypothetical protein
MRAEGALTSNEAVRKGNDWNRRAKELVALDNPEQRSEVAKKAAAARWKGHEPAKGKAAGKKG